MKRLILMAVIAIIAVALVTTPVLTVVAPFVSVWELDNNKIAHIAGSDSIVIDTKLVVQATATFDAAYIILVDPDSLVKSKKYIDDVIGGTGSDTSLFLSEAVGTGTRTVFWSNDSLFFKIGNDTILIIMDDGLIGTKIIPYDNAMILMDALRLDTLRSQADGEDLILQGAVSGDLLIKENGSLRWTFSDNRLTGEANATIVSDTIQSSLFFGGTGTTSDLNLKTTSGVGATGADMHFLVGNDGGTEAMTILNNGRVGIGTNAPNAPLDITGGSPGSVGGFMSGALHITNPSGTENHNSVITGHNTFGGNTQLWYLGSTSSSNNNVAFINRQNANLSLSTNNTERLIITNAGNVGIGISALADSKLEIIGDNNALADLAVEENYLLKIRRDQDVNNTGAGMSFSISSTGSQQTAAIVAERTGSNGQGSLNFYIKQSATSGVAPVLAMKIDSAGIVNIFDFALMRGGNVFGQYDTSDVPVNGDVLTYNLGTDLIDWQPDGGAGLAFFTEADDNDTSVFTATGPNTTVGFNDNLTMQDNDITGVEHLKLDSLSANASLIEVANNIDMNNNSLSNASKVRTDSLYGDSRLVIVGHAASGIPIYSNLVSGGLRWTFDDNRMTGEANSAIVLDSLIPVSGNIDVKGAFDMNSNHIIEVDSLDADKYADGSIDLPDLAVNSVDSTKVADGDLAVDDINWETEYMDLSIVHGYAPADSTHLFVPIFEGYTPILFVDSTNEASAKDTVVVSGTVPYEFTVDSIIIGYKVTGASVLIDSLVLRGPDKSAFTNNCDSTYFSSGTNRTSTSFARLGIDMTNFTARAGDRFAVQFSNDLAADDGTVKVYYIQLVGKR